MLLLASQGFWEFVFEELGVVRELERARAVLAGL